MAPGRKKISPVPSRCDRSSDGEDEHPPRRVVLGALRPGGITPGAGGRAAFAPALACKGPKSSSRTVTLSATAIRTKESGSAIDRRVRAVALSPPPTPHIRVRVARQRRQCLRRRRVDLAVRPPRLSRADPRRQLRGRHAKLPDSASAAGRAGLRQRRQPPRRRYSSTARLTASGRAPRRPAPPAGVALFSAAPARTSASGSRDSADSASDNGVASLRSPLLAERPRVTDRVGQRR